MFIRIVNLLVDNIERLSYYGLVNKYRLKLSVKPTYATSFKCFVQQYTSRKVYFSSLKSAVKIKQSQKGIQLIIFSINLLLTFGVSHRYFCLC